MKKQRIEHKIIKYKDYLVATLMGFIWTAICLVIGGVTYWLLTLPAEDMPLINENLAAMFGTLIFCYGLYEGMKHGFFKPEIREEVIHVIK